MTILVIVYILLLLLSLGYVVVNVFHLLRFRLPVKGDLSLLFLSVYLIVVIGIIIGSLAMGILAYNAA